MIKDSDKFIYFKSIDPTTYMIICLYADDMLILSPNFGTINETKWMLDSNFDMKDMGAANVILCIKILNLVMVSGYHKNTLLRKC